ncbi:hypothetical protein SUDANB19_06622 [Streptomyces sp. enrichment culture]
MSGIARLHHLDLAGQATCLRSSLPRFEQPEDRLRDSP